MRLYLLRHATAAEIAPSDAERPLTAAGKDEARIAAAALAEMGAEISHIRSSPLTRARQTAEIVARTLDLTGELQCIDELKNDASTAALLRSLAHIEPAMGLLLVGHMPSLSEHLAVLIGVKNADGLPLGKGGIACVELDQLRAGAGRLRWLMRQGQLRRIAK